VPHRVGRGVKGTAHPAGQGVSPMTTYGRSGP
jgi:hypothetical protein